MRKLLILFMLPAFIISCQEKKETSEKVDNTDSEMTNTETKTTNTNSIAAVQVNMEGKLHTIAQEDLEPNKVTRTDKQLQLVFWEDGNPMTLNFNVNNEVLENGSGIYNIPEDNALKTLVDLNFYNKDRVTEKKTAKRIIFRKGKIDIKQLTDTHLEMTFEGEASGMGDRKNMFPISGKVNVNY